MAEREQGQGLSRRDALAGAGLIGTAAMMTSTPAGSQVGPAPPPEPPIAIGTRPSARALRGRADPNGRFRGKTLLVTGGTSGFGRAVAEDAARQGAYVAFNGRREQLGRQVEEAIREAGGRADFTHVNMLDRGGLKRWIDSVAQRQGGIDLAFLNAGIAQRSAPIAELPDQHWDEMWRTNVSGMFHATKDVVPHMLRRGGGAIVYTGSAFGHRAAPRLAAYNANKFAVHGFMRAVALELGPSNIRVNAVAPGAVPTTDFGRNNPAPPAGSPAPDPSETHAIGRYGTTEEISKAALWLMTEEASFVQGEVFAVDGAFRVG